MTAKRRAAVKNRAALAVQVKERSQGICEWPQCYNNAKVVAHLQTRGMGGSPSRDTLENLAHLCHLHDWVMEPQNPKRGDWIQLRRYDEMRLLPVGDLDYDALKDSRFNRAVALAQFIEQGGNLEKLALVAGLQ